MDDSRVEDYDKAVDAMGRYMLVADKFVNVLVNIPVVVSAPCIVDVLVGKLDQAKLIAYMFRFARHMKTILKKRFS